MSGRTWTVVDFTWCVFGAGFTAISVWLTVRTINQRERWAKWALAITLSLPVLYVVGFGPACWLASEEKMSATVGRAVCRVYAPLLDHVLFSDDASWSVRALHWWSSVGSNGDVLDLSEYAE
jgi:hypothetical protein